MHLQFKPGSDVAMLNAMLHTIITEGLTDSQYIAGYTEGFDELKERIKDFPPGRWNRSAHSRRDPARGRAALRDVESFDHLLGDGD